MENRIILSQFIEINLGKLGFSNVANKEIIHYFLKKNLITLFGKDEFAPYELEFNTIAEQELDFTNEVPKKRKRNKLQMFYGNTKYIISFLEEENVLEMRVSNLLEGFRMIVNEKRVYNSNTAISENEIVSNFSCLYLNDKPCFDYQKIIYNADGEEIIFPVYRAQPIAVKQGENHLFEIIELENLILEDSRQKKNTSRYELFKQSIKKYVNNLKMKSEIIAVPCARKDVDSYTNLDAIFIKLEEKTNELSRVRKRIKEN